MVCVAHGVHGVRLVCMCQFLDTIVEMERLAPHEREQQWTSEQTGDVPQLPEEVVKTEWFAPRERGQPQTAEQIVECTSLWK